MGRSPTSTLRRGAVFAAATVMATAGLTALSAGPALAATGTTVSPAGHAFSAALVSGTTVTFTVGTTTSTCNQSGSSGTVPAEPANSNPDGPVVNTLAPASFSNNGGACPTNVPFTTARTTSNSTNGDWTISLQYDPAGSVGTMTIPQGGSITQISGLASCTATVAPDGPVSISGAWVPGTDTSPPVLDLSAGVSLPVRVTGGLACPTGATSAILKARYAVTDTTDPAQQITVSAGLAEPPPAVR
ncbi:YD repeat-containing protein [Krasilnikovia cinnamomea]|uniref:YD repeat-containing protein n=1 Tax=Krasilnikovia cinnamomea TaxID=349313 RepID=A0A4V2G6L7_9ACTN|nr:hypothetical protein [Krasilnikovia cinnamomea]RZU49176.1 YD repeat-containing protein [Krasilnikovia cinnamomea]